MKDEESKRLCADRKIYEFAVNRLAKCLESANHATAGGNALEILKGFGNLTAISEASSKSLCELGLVNLLDKVCKDKTSSELELREALKCISMIAGTESCATYIRNTQSISDCMHKLQFVY